MYFSMRTRFKLSAVCRADGTSPIYEATHKAHKNYLTDTRPSRTIVLENIIVKKSEITCAEDLIGRTTIIFKERKVITALDADMYWEAFGANITLV